LGEFSKVVSPWLFSDLLSLKWFLEPKYFYENWVFFLRSPTYFLQFKNRNFQDWLKPEKRFQEIFEYLPSRASYETFPPLPLSNSLSISTGSTPPSKFHQILNLKNPPTFHNFYELFITLL